MACRAASAARSIAVKSLSVPPNVPNGVRTPLRNTTSRSFPCVFMCGAPQVQARRKYRLCDLGAASEQLRAILKTQRQAWYFGRRAVIGEHRGHTGLPLEKQSRRTERLLDDEARAENQ